MKKETVNHNCSRCGKQAEIVQDVYIDGAYKKISYCKTCLGEIINFESEKYLKVGVQLLANHANLVQENSAKGGNFQNSFDEIYSTAPSTILLTLFSPANSSAQDINVDIKKRKLTLLNHRLGNAIKVENYKKAGKIKRIMDEINKTLKQQPW
ncbi:MAG: hypothetical protein ACK4MM_00775 [Fervidobacterium sp.]